MFIFKKLLLTINLLLFSSLLLVPLFSFADELTDPLVPACSGIGSVTAACNFCDFIHLGQHIINFLTFIIAPSLVVIFVAWGAIMLMIGGGSQEKRTKAKGIMTTALWGYVIVLVSWLIIDTIFVTLVDGNIIKDWKSISC